MPCLELSRIKEMRESAEQRLRRFSRFRSVAGSAESTGLESASIDLVTVGRAFHWFDTRERPWQSSPEYSSRMARA